ncbi:indole-3-glycerol phosphate synthase family protein, partial [Vibrio parahaemolyticus VP2007-007]
LPSLPCSSLWRGCGIAHAFGTE